MVIAHISLGRNIREFIAAILLVGGGLTAQQTAAISSGLPFMFLPLLAIYCLHKTLREQPPQHIR